MNHYSDYFELKEYFPVINPNSIQNENLHWQDTYPHETFIELLKKTDRMLGRGNASAKHPLWVFGAYGTGKSQIVWALQNLLTCSREEFNAYFDKYEELEAEKDLRTKLLGKKQQGKIVVAFRYGSDEICGTEALVMAVFESLTKALEEAGFSYDAGKTLRGGIIQWFEKDVNRKYFNDLIQEEPYVHFGCFANRTADDILSRLRGDDEETSLIKGIRQVAKEIGITAMHFTMDDLTRWIRETIETNDLNHLILIWDEFSSFFKNNKTQLDSFQKLAELSDETPFNLVIVTHFRGDIFSENDQSGKIVIDRFEEQVIDMPESIAFKLIAHALNEKNVKTTHLDEWLELADDINSKLKEAQFAVAKMLNGVSADTFRRILPFHPYAALILKNIAKLFDSNQRSMFKFIADDEPDLHAFQWFIQTHGPVSDDDEKEENLLSVDMLWDYFYQTGHGAAGTGKSNLDQLVSSILDVFPAQESKLVKYEQRVMKTVLIFHALTRKLGKVPEFLGTEANLRLAFEGIADLERGRGISIANSLVTKGILFLDEINGKKVYLAPMHIQGRDIAEIEKIKQEKLKSKTKDLIGGFKFEEICSLDAALKFRFITKLAVPETFQTVLNQLIAMESQGYKMKVLMVLGRTPDESYKARQAIQNALGDSRSNGIIFIDASSTNISKEDFDRWAEYSARATYFQKKDDAQAKNAQQDANKILDNWRDAIGSGACRLHSQRYPEGRVCHSKNDVDSFLATAVLEKFEWTFDFEIQTGTAFGPTTIPTITAGLLGGREKLPKGKNCLITTSDEAKLLMGVKDLERYWDVAPTLLLSKIKRKIDSQISKAFAAGGPGKIAIGEIIDSLIVKGFMPTHLSGFLTGFLLKEYASSDYRYSDGEHGDAMNLEKLAEMISGYFKKLNGTESRYKDQYIEVLTEEQRIFAELAKKIFHLQSNSSIESIASQISVKVKDFHYPLWCFQALPEAVGLERFIEQFTLLLNSDNAKGATSGSIATEIGKMLQKSPQDEEKLAILFTQEKAREAMSIWLDQFENGSFRALADEIHATDPLADVRRCFSTDGVWLWDKEIGEEEIRKVLRDYQIVAESVRRGFITPTNSILSCLEAWKEKAKTLRMPCATLISERSDLKIFLKLLSMIANDNHLEESKKRDDFLNEITSHGDLILDFFNGRVGLFKSVYSAQLAALEDGEQEELYKTLDMTSFVLDKSTFERALIQKIEDTRKHQARGKLLTLWSEKTATESPAAWSLKFGTPILAVISDEIYSEAKAVFDAINEKNTHASIVGNAMEILRVHPEILQLPEDQARIDEIFRRKIVGKYAAILSDLNSVRETLTQVLGANVYAWFENPKRNDTIQKLAQSEYQLHCASRLAQRIDQMNSEEAKACLKKLVQNELEVGIEILAGK